jgi:hypothetical protein
MHIFVIFSSILCFITNESKTENFQKEFNKEDTEKVDAVIRDYVKGIYLWGSAKIDKSIDKKLHKVGFCCNPDTKHYLDSLKMTHKQLSKLVAN